VFWTWFSALAVADIGKRFLFHPRVLEELATAN